MKFLVVLFLRSLGLDDPFLKCCRVSQRHLIQWLAVFKHFFVLRNASKVPKSIGRCKWNTRGVVISASN